MLCVGGDGRALRLSGLRAFGRLTLILLVTSELLDQILDDLLDASGLRAVHQLVQPFPEFGGKSFPLEFPLKRLDLFLGQRGSVRRSVLDPIAHRLEQLRDGSQRFALQPGERLDVVRRDGSEHRLFGGRPGQIPHDVF